MFKRIRGFIEAGALLINIEKDIHFNATVDELINKYSDGSKTSEEFIRQTYRKNMLERMGA